MRTATESAETASGGGRTWFWPPARPGALEKSRLRVKANQHLGLDPGDVL